MGMFGFDANGTEAKVQNTIPAAGTVKNFFVFVDTVPGVGQSWTFTVRKTGVNTAVTCTIGAAAQTCSDTTNTAVFAAGELISIGIASSAAPAATSGRWAAQFVP